MKNSQKKTKMISAAKLDKLFDEGKDISKYLDLEKTKMVPPVPKGTKFIFRINIDFPSELLKKVDEEAARIGIPRASLIKMWIAEKLDKLAS